MKNTLYSVLVNLLRIAARMKLQQVKPIVIGVTGSVGKTSCLHLLDAVIKTKYSVRTTFKANSETGLPLGILGIRDKLSGFGALGWLPAFFAVPGALLNRDTFEVLIAEMGIDGPFEPYNMSYLLTIVQPSIGILLNVAPVHTMQFSAAVPKEKKDDENALLDAIAEEKGKLLLSIPKNGTAIGNGDDKRVAKILSQMKDRSISVGENKACAVRLTDYSLTTQGCSFTFTHEKNAYTVTFPGKLYFKEFGVTLGCVLAAAQALGISLPQAIAAIENEYREPAGRLSLIPGKNDSILLDSSYNSSPQALMAVLGMVKNLKTNGKKVLVLGDMRELGDLAEAEHVKLVPKIAEVGDLVVLIGPLMAEYTVPALLKRGFSKEKLYVFKTSEDVGETLLPLLKGEDIVLIKGSQNTIFLETIVRDLMRNPDAAGELLCRQGNAWDSIRAKYFASHPNAQLDA